MTVCSEKKETFWDLNLQYILMYGNIIFRQVSKKGKELFVFT